MMYSCPWTRIFQSIKSFGSSLPSIALRLPHDQSSLDDIAHFGTGLTAGSLISAPVTGLGGNGGWCAPYYVSNITETVSMMGATRPLLCPLGTDKEIRVELGFLRKDELLTMATLARMGSAPTVTFLLTEAQEQKSGCNRLVGVALRPGCAPLIAWRGTSGQVRQGSPLEQQFVAHGVHCPISEISKHLNRVSQMARSSWSAIMTAHKQHSAASRSGDLLICPAALIEFVAGTHFGRSGGQALSEADREQAPALFKLLKLTGSIDTYDFGPLTWHPDDRSTALEAIMDRLALAPGGAGAPKMPDSETGNLPDLYTPCFHILKNLDTGSTLVNHMASPSPKRPEGTRVTFLERE